MSSSSVVGAIANEERRCKWPWKSSSSGINSLGKLLSSVYCLVVCQQAACWTVRESTEVKRRDCPKHTHGHVPPQVLNLSQSNVANSCQMFVRLFFQQQWQKIQHKHRFSGLISYRITGRRGVWLWKAAKKAQVNKANVIPEVWSLIASVNGLGLLKCVYVNSKLVGFWSFLFFCFMWGN